MFAAGLDLNTRDSIGIKPIEDLICLVNNTPLFYEVVSVVQRHTQNRR